MAWAKADGADTGYVNLDVAPSLVPYTPGGASPWYARVGPNGPVLDAGPFATAAEAHEAIRKLVHGFDPSTEV